MSRFTRGMRRLAILAGVIGLAIGGAIAYFQLEELRRIQARHDRFLRVLTSPAMATMVKTAAAVQHELTRKWGKKDIPVPETLPGSFLDWSKAEQDQWLRISAAADQAKANGMLLEFDQGDPARYGWSLTAIKWLERNAPPGQPVGPDSDDVKGTAGPAGKIISIRLRGGEVISETPAPGWPKFADALVFVPLGFLLPWGVVRLLAWTIAGFMRPADEGGPR